MQTLFLGVVIIGATVALSHLGLVIVHGHFPPSVRQANHEVGGYFIGLLGLVYAVLLAFVVVVVWQQFQDAAADVEREGNALISIFQIGTALPEPTAGRVRDGARAYAHVVIDEEWPEMAAGRSSVRAARAMDELWLALVAFDPGSQRENSLYAEGLRRLNDLTDGRRIRLLANQSNLPGTMWGLLIGGGLITVVFTYFFSAPSLRAQAAMTMLYAASLAFVIFLIVLLDYPFRGDLRVQPNSFELALVAFERLAGR